MSDEICGNDTYANARVDAAIVQAVAESSDEPFWIYAQTSLIRWVRTAHRLTGEPEPGIRAITEIAQDKAKLQALVAKAVDRAKTPDERTEARELERWLTDWLSLDPKLISAQMTTLTCIGARTQRTTVTSRDGKHRTRIGERTGSWDLWDPSSLPPYARKAAYDALSELRGGRPSTTPTPDDPGATSTRRATRARSERTGFETMTASIDTIEQAARDAKTAGHQLKNDLTRRNKAGKTPDPHESRLRIRAVKAAEKLETAATDLRLEISRATSPQVRTAEERRKTPMNDGPGQRGQTTETGLRDLS